MCINPNLHGATSTGLADGAGSHHIKYYRKSRPRIHPQVRRTKTGPHDASAATFAASDGKTGPPGNCDLQAAEAELVSRLETHSFNNAQTLY
ncbi:MAG: hypothetical protein HN742_40865 [Lentisphaerae bacterium]|nr:hypothetical protein [Lentisphaerota bacterium]MBT4821457.1 hypothetical protein [Lentisphaerota bacterium]MBT5610156.1 hypothetical protein [Lentisphaerota bacterium]MBT7056960.1 hypothetical protein [Lentisphaerota bacterium]MBT7848288.1 hypothetical protein [Lentisphaerota bacterium]